MVVQQKGSHIVNNEKPMNVRLHKVEQKFNFYVRGERRQNKH